MIKIDLLNILGVAIISNFIAFFYQPIQSTKDKLLNKLDLSSVKIIFNCSKCLGFIIGLILFYNIFAASLCALIGFIITFLINYIEDWYEGT
tara:strand:+ start:839 stop:1114 length:276 start_codon:yes stop_codon:yes gene_type:complete